MKKVLLGTTGLIAATAIAGSAFAGEITLPGALDLRISGTSDFEYEYIDSDLPQATNGRESFFNQDHEIVFRFTGVGDATGITYGANLELELDTGDTSGGDNAQWDEAWGFMRGGWGEFRFGNEDTVIDILKITANYVERGTGGLDGAQRTARPTRVADSGEATKIMYFTPQIAGFQAGVDFAFNGDDTGSQAGTKDDTQDIFTAGANWLGSAWGLDFGAFAGVSSLTPSTAFDEGDRAYNYMVGGLIGIYGVEVAGAWVDNDDGFAIDDFFNVGIGTEIAGVGLSAAYQHENLNIGAGDSDYYVISADTAILPGVALRGDIGYLDGAVDDGFNGVIQLRTAW